ncbi:MAG: hypothetical protein R2697_10975 [Ilumatobacteraceae bacterium]
MVKLDGLAAGRNVTVPADADETEAAVARPTSSVRSCWKSASPARMFAACVVRRHDDAALPLAQDHKRIGEGAPVEHRQDRRVRQPPVGHDPSDLVATFVSVLDYASAGAYVGVLYRPDAHGRWTEADRAQLPFR